MNIKKRNWTPYILLLPSLLYLALFFAFPMVRSLSLAFWKEDAHLTLHSEADLDSLVSGSLAQASTVTVLNTQGNQIEGEIPTGAITEVWYRIHATDAEGQPVEGWTHSDRIRVDETDEATGVPTLGRIRAVRRSGADPQTSVFVEPGSTRGELVGKLDAQTEVEILEQRTLEVWYQVRSVATAGRQLKAGRSRHSSPSVSKTRHPGLSREATLPSGRWTSFAPCCRIDSLAAPCGQHYCW